MEDAIQQAHFAILKSIEDGSGKSGMGTTVVAMSLVGDGETGSDPAQHFRLAWVGDSRAYLWHDSQGSMQLSQISKDQSLVQVLVDIGEITQQQAISHPKKNIITQYVGQPDKELLQVDSTEIALEPGQKILLCSDGLSDEVGDDEIAEILRHGCDNGLNDQAIVETLIAAALRHGGSDNVTVIVVK